MAPIVAAMRQIQTHRASLEALEFWFGWAGATSIGTLSDSGANLDCFGRVLSRPRSGIAGVRMADALRGCAPRTRQEVHWNI